MFARKIVPILLVAGAVRMMMHHHGQHGCEEQPVAEGEQPRGPQFRHSPMAHRGEWGKRVPPMFEMWHKRAHEQEQAAQSAAQQPPASAPAI